MRLVASLLALLLSIAPAAAERVILGLSTDVIPIASNFAGTTLALFGVIEPGGSTRRGGYDAAVIVRGPPGTQVVRRRERLVIIWVNGRSRTYVAAPLYYAALSNRPIPDIALEAVRREHQLGLDSLRLLQRWDRQAPGEDAVFRQAFLNVRQEDELYSEAAGEDHLRFLAPNVIRARIPLPANVPTGVYSVEVLVFSEGFVVGRETTSFTIEKTGFEAAVFAASREQPLLYGMAGVALALGTGWLAGILFRRN
jgi:uncharacterized protein (TIGR02186 family)